MPSLLSALGGQCPPHQEDASRGRAGGCVPPSLQGPRRPCHRKPQGAGNVLSSLTPSSGLHTSSPAPGTGSLLCSSRLRGGSGSGLEPHQGLGDRAWKWVCSGFAESVFSWDRGVLPSPADTHWPTRPWPLPGSVLCTRKGACRTPRAKPRAGCGSHAAPRGLGAEGQPNPEEDTWEKLPGPEVRLSRPQRG